MPATWCIAVATEAPAALGETEAVWLGLLSVVALVALHLAAPWIRSLPGVPEWATASFAGGLAVAYVFLHLLPEVARGNEEFAELIGDGFAPTPLVELGLFAIALGGFLVYYALERWAQRSSAAGSTTDGAFAVHVGALVLYNALIAYSLPANWRISPGFAVVFTIAMGLHFVLSDRGMEEHYGDRFDRWPPRLVLAGGLLAGWVASALLPPTRAVILSIVTAFLAGGILLNVFKEEIPSTRRSHLAWFTAGLVLYAAVLGAVTLLEHGGGLAEAPPGG